VNAVADLPRAVRGAGLIVAVQGVAGLAVAATLVVRAVAGADQRVVNGYGTAAWFALVGAAVLAAGWGLLRGRRLGRGIAVFVNMTLLPVAWYLGVGSHRWGYGGLVGAAAVAVLAALFSPAALRWAAKRQAPSGSC
jgi:peptidoglycan/LPS O-acetylase OafA/YrhL